MIYEIREGNVYATRTAGDCLESSLIGPATYTITERVNSQTVADTTHVFNLLTGVYDEESRTERVEPLPVSPPDRVAQLEAENLELKLALSELAEAQEADKTETQLALAELAEIIAGGT